MGERERVQGQVGVVNAVEWDDRGTKYVWRREEKLKSKINMGA